MVRTFADGLVSVLLPVYLIALGFDTVQVGGLVTATLLGSAAFTLMLGLYAHCFQPRTLLLAACALMLATGVGFAFTQTLPLLLLIAIVGTLNPSAGDVSVFLPLEQSLLAGAARSRDLPALYARANVSASAMGALGALCSAFPEPVARAADLTRLDAMRLAFFVYAFAAVVAAVLYRGLRARTPATNGSKRVPLAQSRGIVLRLSALFTLDSFGGGFVVQALLALWLFKRFAFTLADAAVFFFAASLLAGLSQLLSPVLARRFGLIPTMVYTHIPANVCLVLAAFMPNATLAVMFLLLRMTLSSMDVPARQAFVMAVVPAEERAAAAAVTNVSRSLGSGLAPVIGGALLSASTFGWPLVIAGTLKVAYDVLLLRSYQSHAASRVA